MDLVLYFKVEKVVLIISCKIAPKLKDTILIQLTCDIKNEEFMCLGKSSEIEVALWNYRMIQTLVGRRRGEGCGLKPQDRQPKNKRFRDKLRKMNQEQIEGKPITGFCSLVEAGNNPRTKQQREMEGLILKRK